MIRKVCPASPSRHEINISGVAFHLAKRSHHWSLKALRNKRDSRWGKVSVCFLHKMNQMFSLLKRESGELSLVGNTDMDIRRPHIVSLSVLKWVYVSEHYIFLLPNVFEDVKIIRVKIRKISKINASLWLNRDWM